MTPKFHSLLVKDIRQETADCVSIAFEVPANLVADYQFIQGQYLTLKTQIGGEEVRRSYSICVAPNEGELRVAVKKVQGGIFSTYANELLKVGDFLEVMTPMGQFHSEIQPNQAKKYLAFAGGSGITPMMSIMKAVLHTEPQSQITLIYGNQNRASIIFKEEIDGLKNRFMQRFRAYHVLSKEFTDAPIFTGLMNEEKCQEFYAKLVEVEEMDEVFICGPEPMMDAVEKSLKQVEGMKAKIHIERFTASTAAKKVQVQLTQEDAEKKSTVSIKLDGLTFDIQMTYGGESILDAALKSGADLPFACKGGVCCTCRAKVVQGTVNMDVNYALEADEVAQGFVLTCQSHPTSEKVFVDFDIK
ncbi:MAG: 1,2-phenylacetyl-CoA epoxidase subunit PaaE [Bacteroidia bacterium]